MSLLTKLWDIQYKSGLFHWRRIDCRLSSDVHSSSWESCVLVYSEYLFSCSTLKYFNSYCTLLHVKGVTSEEKLQVTQHDVSPHVLMHAQWPVSNAPTVLCCARGEALQTSNSLWWSRLLHKTQTDTQTGEFSNYRNGNQHPLCCLAMRALQAVCLCLQPRVLLVSAAPELFFIHFFCFIVLRL